MRIAFLTNEFVTEDNASGGLAHYLLRVSLSLRETGNEPVIFVRSCGDGQTEYSGIAVFRVRPVPPFWMRVVNRLSGGIFSGPLGDVATSRMLWKRLMSVHAQNPFDIVQSASYNATNLYATGAIPSVVRISSFEPLWRKAYDKPFTAAQMLYEFLEAKAIKKATAVYGPSARIADHVSKHLKIPVSVLESPFIMDVRGQDNAIPDERLKDKAYLLFFGTIGLLKGCKTIADILEPLLVRHPDLFFVFVGTVEKYQGRPMAEYIIERAGRAMDRVLILPPLNHEALYPVIRRSRAVILPSRIDNLPNTCLEAMYLGKIVVGTRGTSFEQLIDHGESGFLFSPDDPDSLLETVENVLALPENRREAISQKAKLRMEKCSPPVLTPALVELYQKCIREHACPRPGRKTR